MGHSSPIYADKQGTDEAFDEAVLYCLERADKIAFGSRVLFEPELAVGTQINDRLGVEVQHLPDLLGQRHAAQYNRRDGRRARCPAARGLQRGASP